MYLRTENEDAAATERRAALGTQVESLRRRLGPTPSTSDARERLELAAMLCWRGNYDATHEVLLPLLNPDYPIEIALEARQMIADNHYRHDQYDVANRTYHENLEAARSFGDQYWAARAQDGIAWVLIDVGHFTSGEFEEAGRIFEENMALHRKLGKWIPEAMGIYGLSRAAAGMGEYDRAIKLARCSLDLLLEHEGEHLSHLPLLQLANVYRDDGSFDQAIPYYESAVKAVDLSQDPYLQVLVAHNYGTLLKWMGNLDGAIKLWQSVLPTISELEFPRLGSEICGSLAVMAADRGAFEEAYRLQLESQSYGNRVGVISSVLQNQQMLLRSAMHHTGQLEDRLTFLSASVEASEDGIFVLGPPTSGVEKDDFGIHFANVAGAHMLGKRPVDIVHVLVGTVWKSSTASRLIEPSREVFATGNRRSLDPVELEFKEGHPRWYSVKIAKIPDGVAWTVSDVTERETMRQENLAQRDRLEEANSRLVALDREKSEVLGIAAHDLRSPIGNIRSICEFIPTDDPKTAKFVGLIESSADALLDLISNLLDVERIEQGELELSIRPIPIVPILRQIVDQFSLVADDKQIQVRLSVPTESLFVLSDEGALLRVVQNLVSNALKFSPKGSVVDVRSFSFEGRVRVEIQDQGPGISQADRKALFGKFARLSARPTAGESSSGLGLSIVKHLVEAMNGQVGCDSEFGEGAMFWFELDRS